MNTSQRIWNPTEMLLNIISKESKTVSHYIRPESLQERLIIQDKQWQEGAFWGEPRPGHPEGKIIYHICEVLQNVDKITNNPKIRQQLRLIAITHDSFKHLEEQTRPRTDWSKHHAIFALNFSKKHITDKAILDVIELHDEAYYAWRAANKGKYEKANFMLNRLRERLGNNMQLFYLFFKCDTQTGDKYQSPILWFEKMMEKEIDIVDF